MQPPWGWQIVARLVVADDVCSSGEKKNPSVIKITVYVTSGDVKKSLLRGGAGGVGCVY